MTNFWLYRWKDATGISGTGIVAEGAIFEGGSVAMRWTKSGTMGIYRDADQVREIHGHGGGSEVILLSDAFLRGAQNAAMDQMENVPFASVGGLERREAMRAPEWIQGPVAEAEFIRGYQHQSRVMYGDDWQTCSFGWEPAGVIGVEGRG